MGSPVQLTILARRTCVCAVLLCSSVLASVSSAPAQSAQAGFDDPRGVIDQLVSIGFEPINVFLLKEAGLGEVRKYNASFVPAVKEGGQGARAEGLLVGTELPLSALGNGSEEARFSFFLLGQDGMFAATPVRGWSRIKTIENAKSESVMKVEIDEMRHELLAAKGEAEQIEADLRTLRDRAARMAGIDEIIELKTELSRLKSYGEENSADRAQLTRLLNLSEERREPEDIDQRRLELSQELKSAALATAEADRLSQRRQSAAAATVQDKLALIRETTGKNPQELAQEVLRLRTRRKELERQLGSSERPDDF